jgi:hypothetical protein
MLNYFHIFKTARGVKIFSAWEENVRDTVAGTSNFCEGNVRSHGWSGCSGIRPWYRVEQSSARDNDIIDSKIIS